MRRSFVPVFGVDPRFGSIFEVGFAGGHGAAGGIAEVYTRLGWPDGGDVGKTTATIGLMSGIFSGIVVINYSVHKRYTKILTQPSSGVHSQEIFPENQRKPIAYTTVSQNVIEPFAFHLGIIGIAVLIGWEIVSASKYFLTTACPYSLSP